MDHVAGSGLTFGTDHGCAFGNASEGFAEITGATDERNFESMLIHVVGLVGRSENFGLVDVIDAELLQNLSLGEVSDTALCHNGNVHGFHDLADHGDLRHASDAAFSANLRRHAFQRHYRSSSSALRDFCLLRGGDIHNHAALQHLR